MGEMNIVIWSPTNIVIFAVFVGAIGLALIRAIFVYIRATFF